MDTKLIEDLQKIGLSEKEARVYLAALELGPATAQKIAAKAIIGRPNTYIMIESLKKRGLMSSFEKAKRTFFIAGAPKTIEGLLVEDRNKINEKDKVVGRLIPALLSLTSNEEPPRVSVYEGIEGIKNIQRELVETASKTGYIDNIASIDYARIAINQSEIEPLWKDIQDSKIKVRIIYSKSGRKLDAPEFSNWETRRLRSDQFEFKGEISIFGNKVALLTLGKNPTGIVIDNTEISSTMHVLFELAWSSAENLK